MQRQRKPGIKAHLLTGHAQLLQDVAHALGEFEVFQLALMRPHHPPHTRTHSSSRTHTHTHSPSRAHTHTQSVTHTHAHTQSVKNTQTQSVTHTRTHTHTQSVTHTHAHKVRHAHKRTRRPSRTHSPSRTHVNQPHIAYQAGSVEFRRFHRGTKRGSKRG